LNVGGCDAATNFIIKNDKFESEGEDEYHLQKRFPAVVTKDGRDLHKGVLEVHRRMQEEGGHRNIRNLLSSHCCPETGDTIATFNHANEGQYLDLLLNENYTAVERTTHFTAIANAVAFMHACGWACLDISLDNLSMWHGQPIISDLTMSLPLTVKVKSFQGRSYYAAPELWHADDAGCAVAALDLWSLGILLFTLLARTPPFQRAQSSDSSFKYIAKHPADGVKRFVELLTNESGVAANTFSSDAVGLCAKLLRTNPEERLPISQVIAHPFCVCQMPGLPHPPSIPLQAMSTSTEVVATDDTPASGIK
jgi:serine/threonine protein kinase